jgi:beta-carotene 3-hydroxylase
MATSPGIVAQKARSADGSRASRTIEKMWAFAILFLGTFAAMEGFAYLMHKHLMHGPLWMLHESHHRPRHGTLERNDLFGVFFALPSMVLIYFGTHGFTNLLAVGSGMTAYGAAYFGFHDVVVHRRVRNSFVPKNAYVRRIIRAHLIHHRTLTREGAVSYGFLYAPDFGSGGPFSRPE